VVFVLTSCKTSKSKIEKSNKTLDRNALQRIRDPFILTDTGETLKIAGKYPGSTKKNSTEMIKRMGSVLIKFYVYVLISIIETIIGLSGGNLL
jgi:hypothetical protein